MQILKEKNEKIKTSAMTNSTLAIADKKSYIAPLNHAVNSVLSK